jgi:DNA-directed RNA polymerase specialized sigma subunit
MTAKEYLSGYHNLLVKIEKLKKEVDLCNHLSYQIPGMNFEQVRVDGTKKLEAPFVKWIHKALDYERQIKELEKQLPIVKDEIMQVINQLEDIEYKRILVYRYIDWLSWNEIAKMMFISNPTVRRKHTQAIDEIRLSRGEQG